MLDDIQSADKPLQGAQRWIARLAWSLVVASALIVWLASISPYFHALQSACTGDQCLSLAVTPEEQIALKEAGVSPSTYAGLQTGGQVLSSSLFSVLGFLLFWRRSSDRMALFVSLTLILLGSAFFTDTTMSLLGRSPSLDRLINLYTSLAATGFLLLFFIFPDGRVIPSWSRFVISSIAGYMLVSSLLVEGPIFYSPGLAGMLWYVSVLAGFAVGLYAQVHRYRHASTPVQRQQTKWVVFGLGAVVLGTFSWALGIELFRLPPGPTRLFINLFAVPVILTVSSLFPLTLAIAILRYRLWEIDNLVNRTLVFGALTGMLAALYYGSVLTMQVIFRALTGQESSIAIVVSTLAIAALFTPLRRKLQAFIDRRFYRAKYDAEQTLAAFAVTVRDEVEIGRVTGALLAAVDETMKPSRITFWSSSPPSALPPEGAPSWRATEARVGDE